MKTIGKRNLKLLRKRQVLMLRRFWQWYQTKLTYAIGFMFFVQIIQIPHMWWAADAYLQTNTISNINPIFDFILYGIDLIEIPTIINTTLLFIAHVRK